MSDVTEDEGAIPVTFGGERYVWIKYADGSGALAYPDHVDTDGNIAFQHVFSESFAHVMRHGIIMRYGVQIGTIDDLVFLAGEENK